jgi:hypothetical protein
MKQKNELQTKRNGGLRKVCEPFQMNESYESWLRIIPLEIYSTTAKIKGDQFSLQMGMKCNIETLIGNKPESKFDIKLF